MNDDTRFNHTYVKRFMWRCQILASKLPTLALQKLAAAHPSIYTLTFFVEFFDANGRLLLCFSRLRWDFLRATAYICHSAYMPQPRQFRPSVRPSVTRVLCGKTAERIIEILSLSVRPIIIVFVAKGRCANLTTSPPTGAPNTRGRG